MKTQTHILNQHTSKPIILDIELANEEDAPLIIFAHGFKGFKDWGHFNLLSKAFSEKGFHFLKFNFSCNGGTIENPIDFPDLEAFGNNTFSQEQEDLQIVINWAFDYLQPSSVILMGHSRGGGATIIKAANDNRISKLITDIRNTNKIINQSNELNVLKVFSKKLLFKLGIILFWII